MLILLQDAQKVPRIFFPFGAIPIAELQDWLRRTGLILPSDLIELWQLTGGGDVFESETIFRPTVPSAPNGCFVEDEIEGRNTACAEEGKSADLYVFQQGAFLSAVRLSDHRFVTLTEPATGSKTPLLRSTSGMSARSEPNTVRCMASLRKSTEVT